MRKLLIIATLLVCLVMLVHAGCNSESDLVLEKSSNSDMRLFRACESIRSSDPEIAPQGITELFDEGGLAALSILHLKWIQEPNPEIRKYILEGFAKIGDHRNIADPGFPQEWVEAASRYPSPEKEARLEELEKYFPEAMLDFIGAAVLENTENVSSMDEAFLFIARDYHYGIVKLAEEFEVFSEHEIVETKDYGIFHIIYANMEQNIRGMGGNGPVYVFRENNNQYKLVYHNASDEMVNRVEIIEDSDFLKLHIYAHVGLMNGLDSPIVYIWNGSQFIYKH